MHHAISQVNQAVRAVTLSVKRFIWNLMFALIVFVMLLSSSSLLSFQARLPLKSYYWVLQFVSLIIASCVAYSVGQFVTKKKKKHSHLLWPTPYFCSDNPFVIYSGNKHTFRNESSLTQ